MSKKLSLISLLLTLFIFILPSFAQTNDSEKILYFDSTVIVNRNASIDVTENISVYANRMKIIHGIVRRLPTRYADSYGIAHHTTYQVTKVQLNNQAIDYHIQHSLDKYEIFIGSKDIVLAPGIYTYTIQYHVDDAINFLKDADELYWNITGNDWDFPIVKAEAEIHLPAGTNILNFAGYTGYKGKKEQFFYARKESNNVISFATTEPLQPGQGLTAAVSWPKGIIQQPTMLEHIEAQNGPSTYVPLIILLVMVVYYVTVWNKHGRGPHKGAIIPVFEPPATISPAAARFILRMGFDAKTFTAAIMSMAVKKFLTIQDTNGSYNLIKNKDDASQLSEEEKAAADNIFASSSSITVSRMNYSAFNRARSAVKKSLKNQYQNRFFILNSIYLLPGILLMLAAFAAVILLSDDIANTAFSVIWVTAWSFGCICLLSLSVTMIYNAIHAPAIGNVASAVVISIFSIPFLFAEVAALFVLGNSVPLLTFPSLILIVTLNVVFYILLKVPTLEGRKIMDQLEGFKLYLGTTERSRLDQMNQPDHTPDTFELFLPYAIALNVEYGWGQRFNNLLMNIGRQPNTYHPFWYTGNNKWTSATIASFPVALASSLGATLSSVSSSSSASGGDGSSGGGGGGGGGGGW